MNILSEIVRDVEERVESEMVENPLREEAVIVRSSVGGLREAIEADSSKVSLIGEYKMKSPSAGTLRRDISPVNFAKSIKRGGAVGVSVLTEPHYFGGRYEFLSSIKASVHLPILRKDFILKEYQLHQSLELGADAVLLIADVLGRKLSKFVRAARSLSLESLVEVRNEEEAELASAAEPDMIGINNRNLRSMEVDISRTERILDVLSADVTTVSESGIESSEDMARIAEAGADAALVGTSLMESDDIENKARSLSLGGKSNGKG